jgi:hypothetical protein
MRDQKVTDARFHAIDPVTGRTIPRWQVWRTHRLVLAPGWWVVALSSGAIALISYLRG